MGSRPSVGTTDVSPPVKNNSRQNEPAGRVDISTGVEVCMTLDPGHV